MSLKDDAFKIYVEQLRDGHVEKLHETFAPNFLDIHEEELHFNENVTIEGEAYLADENLILHLQIATQAIIPCSICNGPVETKILLPNFYHMEPLADVKSGIFDFSNILREAILLEVPGFAECHNGNCPERKQVAKYLKEPAKKAAGGDKNIEDGYQPFADIDFDQFNSKN
jgi:uncharacterized metal-binding protein YceD (DUF177 family)